MLEKIDNFQQRHAFLAIPLAVIKKFGNDKAGNLASLIAYNGFFAIFPLLLLFTTILGFVLQGDQSAQRSIVNSALGQFPIISTQVKAHSLTGSGVALAVGIVGSLLGGLGVTLQGQNAFNKVYAVPERERPNFLHSRLRGLAILVVLGLLQVVSTGVSGAVTGGASKSVFATVGGIVVSLLLNGVLFFATFRLLTDDSVPTRELWPGVACASILWLIIQSVGGAYIGHVVKNDSNTYGTFATVIGLLVWLHLGAQAVIYSAELNTVLSRKLWPRSLFGAKREEDRRVLEGVARTEEQVAPQRVHVSFEDEEKAQEDRRASSGEAGDDRDQSASPGARRGT